MYECMLRKHLNDTFSYEAIKIYFFVHLKIVYLKYALKSLNLLLIFTINKNDSDLLSEEEE